MPYLNAEEMLAGGTVDLTPLDKAVNVLCTKLLYMMPDCINKTLNSMRKKKLELYNWEKAGKAYLGLFRKMMN